MVIENFAMLPEKEQHEFAADLVNKINSSKVFSDDAFFSLDDLEASDMTGGLYLELTVKDIYFKREVTWQDGDDEDIQSYYGPTSSMPEDLDYIESVFEDIKTGFKAESITLDGYTLTIEDIADTADEKIEEINVSRIRHEDDGIGSYEFWGMTGYDSNPYVEVEAIADCTATAYILLHVVAADQE